MRAGEEATTEALDLTAQAGAVVAAALVEVVAVVDTAVDPGRGRLSILGRMEVEGGSNISSPS